MAPSASLHLNGLSVILPVHNEAGTVDAAIPEMLKAAERVGVPFEIVVCENGSRDETLAIVERFANAHTAIRVETLQRADYGHALQHGIQVAAYDKIVIFNVDFWSAEFLETALVGLDTHDMVVGSKVMGTDRRPIVRRIITRSFNWFLRIWFGFRGTDTHGMKAFRRQAAGQLAAECVSKGSTFDTELVLRAEREGLLIVERPVDITEIRPPSYASIVSRIPELFRNLTVMQRALRKVQRRAGAASRGDEAVRDASVVK
jgi:glycosyltransferase involved in cell wall biosynthesis